MKTMFSYASLLLAAATLNSCSQDSDLAADEAATAAAGALTPEQRVQIMDWQHPMALTWLLQIRQVHTVSPHKQKMLTVCRIL